MRRSTRQSSKPVIIDLRRTDIGFEVFDEKDIYQSVIPKPTVPRPEKPLSYPKSLSSKIPAMEKEAASPSSSMQAAEGLQRSRTMGKLPAVPPKVTIQNGATMPERSPVPTRPGDFAIKKELYAFSNLSMPSIRMGTMGESAAAAPPSDLFSSSQFERPTGPAFSHGVQPSGPAYHRPVERPQKNFPVAIPSVAQWFQMEKIHQIEKDYMPEFFVGKSTKTPEVYKRYRDFMINQYRQNPSNYLNATTCRKSLAGDACSIMRLHAFLEHWGLINFYIDPSGYPKNLFLNRANYTAERLLEFQNRDLKMDLIEQAVRNNLSSADNDLLIDEIRAMEKQGRPLCDFCGLGCGSIWYMHKISDQKNGLPEFGLEDKGLENGARKGSNERRLIFCIQCYHNKNFPGLLTENDFEKVNLLSHLGSETTIAEAIGSWSQEDSFKLVDLVQKHGDNWAEIQKSFPHRTKDDLVLHYLRMPIEKITSINILEMGEFRGHEDAPDDRIADLTPTVFGDYSNPILQHVAVFRSLLVKHKEQKKLKKKKATMAAKAEERKATKLEERSDLEITKVSDAPKEEEPSNTGEQMVTEPKIEGGETSQGEKELEIGKEDEMEEEKESPNGPDKTAQELSKHVANRLVELQIHKLDGKVEFLDEYERIIQHERKQYEVLQQSLISERVEVARKRAEVLKQHAPPPQQVYPEQTLDTGYFDFNPHGGAFGADDMLDLGMDKIEGFPKDTF